MAYAVRRTNRNESGGFAFLILIFIVVAQMTMSMAAVSRAITELQISTRSLTKARAFDLAEAGVDRAIQRLHDGFQSPTTIPKGADHNCAAILAGSFIIMQPSVSLGGGSYNCTVAPTGTPNEYRIQASGQFGSVKEDLEAVVQLDPLSVFQGALFGDEEVQIDGMVRTDSYDSALGSYGVPLGGGGYNVSNQGNVGTNQLIDLNNSNVGYNTNINGVFQTATGSPASVSVINAPWWIDPPLVNGAVVNGAPYPSTSVPQLEVNPFPGGINPMPSVTEASTGCTVFPDLALYNTGPATPLPTGMTWDPTNNTYWYAPGKYCLGNVTIAYSNLLPTDPAQATTIYPMGSVDLIHAMVGTKATDPLNPSTAAFGAITLSILFPDENPTPNFKVAADDTSAPWAIVLAAIYGKYATITAGNRGMLGAVAAQSIQITTGAWFHYDEALGSQGFFSGLYNVRVITWLHQQTSQVGSGGGGGPISFP